MKIVFVSDTHGDEEALKNIVEFSKGYDAIIHTGDVLPYGVAHSCFISDYISTLDNIYFVRGNTDYFDRETKDTEIFEIDGKKVILTHGHLFGVKSNLKELEEKAISEKVDICIFGHTHKEYMEERNGIIYLNPGALQDKKYVIYDNKKFEQKILK